VALEKPGHLDRDATHAATCLGFVVNGQVGLPTFPPRLLASIGA
jgi:hypothetical protein